MIYTIETFGRAYASLKEAKEATPMNEANVLKDGMGRTYIQCRHKGKTALIYPNGSADIYYNGASKTVRRYSEKRFSE